VFPLNHSFSQVPSPRAQQNVTAVAWPPCGAADLRAQHKRAARLRSSCRTCCGRRLVTDGVGISRVSGDRDD